MPGEASAWMVLCLPVASPARRKTTDSARRMWRAFLWEWALGDVGMNGCGERGRGGCEGSEGKVRTCTDERFDRARGGCGVPDFIFCLSRLCGPEAWPPN